MKGLHGMLVRVLLVLMIVPIHAAPSKSHYVCLPHRQEPCTSYRITTQDDVAHQCAFSFDPRQLGCKNQEECTRCWFKIHSTHKKAIYEIIKDVPEKTRMIDVMADLEKKAPASITPDNHREALMIIKDIVDLSSGEVQAWHFTAWLAYERPLALKK